jgi:Ca2+-binding RTX toxin-like protein
MTHLQVATVSIALFNTALATAGIDILTDFNPADDTIKLENAIFTKLTTVGILNAANLVIGTVALDANDYFIYNSNTGALFYDADGNGAGAAIQIAVLGTSTHPTISNLDFVVM